MSSDFRSVATEDSGVKYDNEKLPMSLLPVEALEEVTAILAFGAGKYGPHNWRGGMKWSRLLSASLRHIFAFIGGQDKDHETGRSHLAHAVCCLLFLITYEKDHPQLDDRYKK